MKRTEAAMGTLVSIELPRVETSRAAAAIKRAFGWFQAVERHCSRFDPESELMRLCRRAGEAVAASPILVQAVAFALAVAEASGGAFDPVVGAAMARRGYDRHYRTGAVAPAPPESGHGSSFRDVRVNAKRGTIELRRPLRLDLGAVAKGLAIDMAVRELRPWPDFAVDAGGDLYLSGVNGAGEAWRVGIRHPRLDDTVIEALRISGAAVCTSGDYERGGHILDPRSGSEARAAVSATVIAPTAMAADALATAACVLGPVEGIALLERQGVAGLIVASGPEGATLQRFATRAPAIPEPCPR